MQDKDRQIVRQSFLKSSVITIPIGAIAGIFGALLLFGRPTWEEYLIVLLLGVLIAGVTSLIDSYTIYRESAKTIEVIDNFAKSFSRLDFTAPLEADGSSHLSTLVENLQGIKENFVKVFSIYQEQVIELNDVSNTIQQIVDTTGEVNRHVTETTDEFLTNIKEHGDTVKERLPSLQELSQINTNMLTRSKSLQEGFRQTEQEIQKDIDTVDNTHGGILEAEEAIKMSSDSLAALQDSSTKIESIIRTINNVSKQTHLIALNAAIEAARAGEQGASFAVVATRIRNLAQEASQATSDITSMVTGIQNAVNSILEGINKTQLNIGASKQAINRINERFPAFYNNIRTLAGWANEISNYSLTISNNISPALELIDKLGGTAEATTAKAEIAASITQEQATLFHELEGAGKRIGTVAEEIQRLTALLTLPTD